MKIDKRLEKIAKKIVAIEKDNPLDKDVQLATSEIEELISHLSFEELLAIDEYIISKKLLDKK